MTQLQKNKLKDFFKRQVRNAQEWEGPWLLPLMFLLVLWVSAFMVNTWGPWVGIFPPGLLNGVIIAAFAFFSGFSAVNFMINLYHRGWYRYYYNKREVGRSSVKDDFKHAPLWLRVIFIPVLQLLLLWLFFWLVVNLI